MSTRTIKFRAWNGKAMTSPFDLGELAHHYDNDYFVDYWGEIPYDIFKGEVVLMQFTGLFDSEGEEIFEGDVVEWSDTRVGEVKFGKYVTSNDENEDILGWMVVNQDRAYALDPQVTYKVLGSVYQNPDLLS